MELRRRSGIVMLTLIGLPVGAAMVVDVLPAGNEVRRNLYPDRGACERDYSPAQCEPRGGTGGSSSGSGGTSPSGGYRGPAYYADRSLPAAASDPGTGRTGQITRTESSIRGGFGGFGRGARAGT